MKNFIYTLSIFFALGQGLTFGQWKHELDIKTPVYYVNLSIDTYVSSTDGGYWSTSPYDEELNWEPRPNFNTYSINIYGVNSRTKNAWGGHVKDSYFNQLPMLSELPSLVGSHGGLNFYVGGAYGPAIHREGYLGVYPTNTKNLEFVTTTGILSHGNNQYCTTERGLYLFNYQDSSWANTGNEGLTDLYISTATSYKDNLYGGTRDGIWISYNDGGSWTKSSIGMPSNTYIYCFLSKENLLIAGTSKGLFGSLNDGRTWGNITNGLKSNYIYSMSLNYEGSRLHVGTGSDGVWSISLAEIQKVLGIKEYSVSDNIQLYPNPTSGKFSVKFNEDLQLALCTIRDISGRVVYEKAISDKASIVLENNLKGIFFVEVKSDKYFINRKLVIE